MTVPDGTLRLANQADVDALQAQLNTALENVTAATIGDGSIVEGKLAPALVTKIDGAYVKPSDGIPETDFASAVQAQLALAESALQTEIQSYRQVITDDALVDTDAIVDVVVAGVTLTLSDETTAAEKLYVIRNASDGDVTIMALAGQAIAGQPSLVVSAGAVVTVFPTGTQWVVLTAIAAAASVGTVPTVNVATVSGSYAIPDTTLADENDLTVIGDTTFFFPPAGVDKTFTLRTNMDGYGGHAIAFPPDVNWENGTAPTPTSRALASDLWTCWSFSGEWYGRSVGSDMHAPRVPQNVQPPSISGTTTQGDALTAAVGTWASPGSTYTYQWNAAGTAIGGATSSSYTLTSSELAKRMTVTVTTTNGQGTGSATSFPSAQVCAPVSGTVRYIRTAAVGAGDGTTMSDAAAITSISTMISAAGADGQVLIRADEGSYSMASTITIAHGGTAGHPVLVRGVDVSGNDMTATFVGNRTAWTLPTDPEQVTEITGWTTGTQPFELITGASNLTFKGMAFQQMGYGCFRVAVDMPNITFDTLTFYNVGTFLEQTLTGSATSASVTGLTVQNCSGIGFSKQCVRLRYNTNDVVVRNCTFNSGRQDGDHFAEGIHVDNTAHNVWIDSCTISNCHDSWGTGSGATSPNNPLAYWNSDGFGGEAGNYNINLLNCVSFGNADAGYDYKSASVTFIHCLAYDNKRNYRLWGDGGGDIDLYYSEARDPNYRGGTGSAAHFGLYNNADVFFHSGAVVDTGTQHAVFSVVNNSIMRHRLSQVTMASSGPYAGTDSGTGYVIFQLADPPDATPPTFTGSYSTHTLENQALLQVMTVTEPLAVPNSVQASGVTLKLTGGADKALMTFVAPNLTMTARDYEFDVSAAQNETYVGIVQARDGWRNTTNQEVDFIIDNDPGEAVVTTRYIAPVASGAADGSTIADAAVMSSLNGLITAVGPDGEIRILADQGSYALTASTVAWIKTGGTPGHPVTIRGWNGTTSTEQEAVLVGTRRTWTAPSTYQPIDASGFGGNTLFILSGNAQNLVFRYLNPTRFARVFDCSAQTLDSLTFEHIDLFNIRDGLYTNTSSVLTNVLVDGMNAVGVSKKVIRCHGDSNNWTVQNSTWDSRWQDKDSFYVGLEIYDTAHDITADNCTSSNGQDTESSSSYWNSDGFSSERGNYNITYNNCTSFSHTDAGFDNKGRNVAYNNCYSYDNKKNFRLWSFTNDDGTPGATLDGCHSKDPFWRGGTEGAYHLWEGDTVSLDPNYVDSSGNRGGNGANIVVKNTLIENTLPDPQPHRSPAAVTYDHGGTGNILRWMNNTVTNSSAPAQGSKDVVLTGSTSDVTAPTITSGNTLSAYNKGVVNLPLTASEPVTWRIVGGADASLFSITAAGFTNQVGANLHMVAWVYTGTSADTKVVQIQAMDVNLNVSAVQTITVTVGAVAPPYTFRCRFEGANNATTATDEGGGKPLTFGGNAKLTTTNPLEGASSLLLDGSGDSVTTPDSTDWQFGQLFSVIAKINMDVLGATQFIIGQVDSGSGTDSWGVRISSTGELTFLYGYSGTQTSAKSTTGLGLVVGTTYEIAADRDASNNLRLYCNGRIQLTTPLTQIFPDSAMALRIGMENDTTSPFKGRIDDVRIWNGYAFCASDAGYTPE